MSTSAELAYGSGPATFPSTGMRVLSALIAFLGVSILAHCLSRRLATEQLTSLRGWKDLSWPRFCILVVFLDSWLFLFTGGILIFAIGLEERTAICSVTIHLCVAFYGISKIFIYCFLIEKVYVVWAPTTDTKRFRLPIYVFCVVTVALYTVVAILLFIGSIHYLRTDGVCIIGLDLFASIPLLSYDIYVNIFLTCLFLWPLVRTGRIRPMLRRVAIRTLIGSIVALTTSTVNVLMLTLRDGKELGWVCVGSCGADIICNALALFWVTAGSGSSFSRRIDIGIAGFPHVEQDVWVVNEENHPDASTLQCSFPCGKVPDGDVKEMLHEDVEHDRIRYQSHQPQDILPTVPPTYPQSSLRQLSIPAHSRSGSKSPWSMESVTGLFQKSQEQQERHQLEVNVTTERDIIEESINSR